MTAQQTKHLIIVPIMAALGVAGVAVFLVLSTGPEVSTAPEMPAPAQPAAIPQPDSARANPPSPGSATQAPAPGSAPSPARRAAPRDHMARDLERERIWSALRREHQLTPAAPGAAAPSPTDAAQLPALDPAYIKSAIADQLVPIAIECYESALEDDPELSGKLVANFVIVGAQDIGGIVEEASISEDSTLDNAFVRECMRESLMAVSFEPPTDGGRVEVTYPFEFESE